MLNFIKMIIKKVKYIIILTYKKKTHMRKFSQQNIHNILNGKTIYRNYAYCGI